jgi:HEAT repeat protein
MSQRTDTKGELGSLARQIADETLEVWSYHVKKGTSVLANEHKVALLRLARTRSAELHVTSAIAERLISEDWEVREAAARVMLEIGRKPAIKALIARLPDGPRLSKRPSKYWLMQMRFETAKKFLERHMKADSQMHRPAARAVGQVSDPVMRHRLIAQLTHNKSKVRERAARRLSQVGDSAAKTALAARLSDKNWRVRHAAAEALGQFPDSAMTEALTLLLVREDNWQVRSVAAEALENIGDSVSNEALTEVLLTDANRNVRRAAAEALGRIGDPTATEALITTLADELSSVRAAAAEALGQIGGEAATEALTDALADEDWRVRQTAAEALNRSPWRVFDERSPYLSQEVPRVHNETRNGLGPTPAHDDLELVHWHDLADLDGPLYPPGSSARRTPRWPWTWVSQLWHFFRTA